MTKVVWQEQKPYLLSPTASQWKAQGSTAIAPQKADPGNVCQQGSSLSLITEEVQAFKFPFFIYQSGDL